MSAQEGGGRGEAAVAAPALEIQSVDVEESKSWERVLSVALPSAAWQQARARVLVGLRRKVQLPGFRKGKAPKELISTQYAGQLDVDALEWLLPRAYGEALRRVEIHPVGDPEFSEVHYGADEPFTFKATVQVKPAITVSGIQGLKVTWYTESMPEDAVDRTLEGIRQERADFEAADRPAGDGDRLTVDFRQVESGVPIVGTEVKGHVFELGHPQVLSGFSDGIRGMAAGEERSFPVTYPDDYEQRTLAGQTRNFMVTLHQLEEKKLPDLDDDFARNLGDFKDMTALRERIDANIRAEIEQRNRQRLETALVQALLAINEFEAPPVMVENYVESMIAEQERRTGRPFPSDERARAVEGLNPGAAFALKRWLVLDAVAAQEGLAVSDEDFEAHLASMAEAEGAEVAKVRRSVERMGAEGRIREDLLHRRVFELLESQATIKQEAIPEGQGGAR
ncbi:MAG: trigger factor [Candidatus Krumholzibacteriota bacterium]|nr:trigger factor [Candidatus Krumholzibacteriota bacterium]